MMSRKKKEIREVEKRKEKEYKKDIGRNRRKIK
jgi:hypothetical protein